mgnify:FL=1
MQFTLRPWQPADLESLVRYANNPRVAQNLMNSFPHPYTEVDGRAFISLALQMKPPNRMGIEINGEAAGGIGLHLQPDIYCKNAELGYWLAEPYWGNGVMTEVVAQMVAYGFQHFDIDRIFAKPFGSNLSSQRVLEKAGFVLEGRFEKTIFKNGVYQDELVYTVRRVGL